MPAGHFIIPSTGFGLSDDNFAMRDLLSRPDACPIVAAMGGVCTHGGKVTVVVILQGLHLVQYRLQTWIADRRQ